MEEYTYSKNHGTLYDSCDGVFRFLEYATNVLNVRHVTHHQLNLTILRSDAFDGRLRHLIVVSASCQGYQMFSTSPGELDGQAATNTLESSNQKI